MLIKLWKEVMQVTTMLSSSCRWWPWFYRNPRNEAFLIWRVTNTDRCIIIAACKSSEVCLMLEKTQMIPMSISFRAIFWAQNPDLGHAYEVQIIHQMNILWPTSSLSTHGHVWKNGLLEERSNKFYSSFTYSTPDGCLLLSNFCGWPSAVSSGFFFFI